jgi:hypothetical protein
MSAVVFQRLGIQAKDDGRPHPPIVFQLEPNDRDRGLAVDLPDAEEHFVGVPRGDAFDLAIHLAIRLLERDAGRL